MLNIRQKNVNWDERKTQKIINASLNQEIFEYFQSSDGSTQWIGIGSTLRMIPDVANDPYSQVSNWFNQIKKELPSKIDLSAIAIIGGFPFSKSKKNSSYWKEWTNGIFILPRIIIKITPEKTTVSEIKQHEFADDDIENTFEKLVNMARPLSGLKSFQMNDLDPKWDQTVDRLVTEINNSEGLKKVVLGRYKEGFINGNIEPADVLKALNTLSKTTYHFMLKIKGQLFISATPERLFKVDHASFSTAAVAGTIARGQDEFDDNRLALKLYKDHKNRQEHQIVVDEIVKRVHDFSTDVSRPDEPMILKNQTVQHLYTPITANLKGDADVFQLVKKMHPTPALGGMPTTEAMDLIGKLETQPRVLFGSPIGYVSFADESEFIVGIRSMYLYYDRFLIFAGAGIMPDSVGKSEFEETSLKFQPMIKLLQYLEEPK